MNIHEYQAKELFAAYGIPVQPGATALSEAEFDAALAHLPEGKVVVKAQIHAGGRGKGTFTDGFKGGVKIAASHAEAKAFAASMLGNTLVTHQTGPAGRKVQTIYFTAPCDIAKEYYLSLTLDRSTGKLVFIASTEGGVNIEEVAAETPEKIVKVLVDPATGLQPFHQRQLAFGLGFTDKAQQKQMAAVVAGLYRMYLEKDCAMVEINPLITTADGAIQALDAKVGFDSNALFRHPDILALRDLNEEDPKEIEAAKHGLSYIALDGNIACLVNGAGLAMSTMDIIKHFGGNPANFLDVGGGASEEAVTEAFRIILSDPQVEGILVNIFGGIMSCARIAKGVIGAARNVELTVPLVVRLEGNEVAEGKQLLADSGLPLITADSLSDAARKIVAAVAEKASAQNR
jgi:succinyl-CoA synthetase beta subunit